MKKSSSNVFYENTKGGDAMTRTGLKHVNSCTQKGGDIMTKFDLKSHGGYTFKQFNKGGMSMRKQMTKIFAAILTVSLGVGSAMPVVGAEKVYAAEADAYPEITENNVTPTEDSTALNEEMPADYIEAAERPEEAEEEGAVVVDDMEVPDQDEESAADAIQTEDESVSEQDADGTDQTVESVNEPEENVSADAEISEEDISAESEDEELVGLRYDVVKTREELVDAIRTCLRCREEVFYVYVDLPEGDYNPSYYNAAYKEAKTAHTGFFLDGDYLNQNLAGGCCLSLMTNKGRIEVHQSYKQSEKDELTVSALLPLFLYDPEFMEKSDIDKVVAIHDFICEKFTYDDEYVSDGKYNVRDSVYMGLDKSAPVYNAYAVLFYRMALQSGLDCRVVEGDYNGVHHNWNIVKLGNKYYNIDVALDDWLGNKEYFLDTDKAFIDHTRDSAYRKADFVREHPMATARYSYSDPVSLETASVRTNAASYAYTGTPRKPGPTVKVNGKTLVLNRDYTVSYRNNVNLGTAKIIVTGIGSYTGTASTTFKIVRRPLTDASVKTKASSYVYTGSKRCPKPIVKVGNRTLTLGTDYKLSYKNNVNCGTATVIVTGIGNYRGTAKGTFRLTKSSIAGASVTTKSASYPVTGKARCPKPIVKVGNRTLTLGTDYTLSYKNNVKVGKATVIVTGIGNYSGVAKGSFKLTAK